VDPEIDKEKKKKKGDW